MKLRTIQEADVAGKRVLVRVDFNVPISNGKVDDDMRIRAALETIQYLVKQKAKIILLSHLGRPDGTRQGKYRLEPVFDTLRALLSGQSISYVPHCAGEEEAEHAVGALQESQILLLENIRFCEGEETNDPGFIRELARLGDVYVNDAFGSAHRAHASTAGIAATLPSYAGFLLAHEVAELSKLVGAPKRPYVGIIGGAKISTKLGVIKELLKKVDYLLLGGALANTILKAQGLQVGKSLIEETMMEQAKHLPLTDNKLHIPVDVVVAQEASERAHGRTCAVANVGENETILDVGPDTINLFQTIIYKAETVVWNGPMGWFELERFSNGTKKIASAVASTKAFSVAGGGETLDAIHGLGLGKRFSFLSSGGGAMLEFLEGKTLPGIAPLMKKVKSKNEK